MVEKHEISTLEVSLVGNKSVLTTSKVFKPLKVFELKRSEACHLVFSNYGGGFVESDRVVLEINCNAYTTTVISTQANTRIYKSNNLMPAKQEVKGRVGEGAFVVFMGEPVVPQKDSLFEQAVHWELGNEGVIMMVDWFEAGRILNEERFAFTSFLSECKVVLNELPLVWDRFKIEPNSQNVNSPGSFLHHSSYVNIFLVGHENLTRVKALEGHLRFLSRKYFQEEKAAKLSEVDIMGVATKVNENIFLIRCSAKNNELLTPMIKELGSYLEEEGLLGFNPLGRKF